ncbi:MAG: hypothetical protein ABJC12_04825 [Saprospiraceae bacterium]
MANRTFLPSAPNKTLWLLAIILGIAGIIVHYFHVEQISSYSFELVMIAFVLLLLGTANRNM